MDAEPVIMANFVSGKGRRERPSLLLPKKGEGEGERGDGGGGMEEAQKRTFHACLEGGRSSLSMFTIRQKRMRD